MIEPVLRYRCLLCPRDFGDPGQAHDFQFWEFTIREHMRAMHDPIRATSTLVNDLLRAVWT